MPNTSEQYRQDTVPLRGCFLMGPFKVEMAPAAVGSVPDLEGADVKATTVRRSIV